MKNKMRTYTLTTNNAKNINDFAYQIVRDDNLVLYSNGNYEYVYQELCRIALDKQMHHELANFIIL